MMSKINSNKNNSSKKKFYTIAFVIFGIFLINCNTKAQVSATFKADSNEIEIGDPLKFKLVIQAEKNAVIEFPNFSGDTIGKLEIISKEKIDTSTLGKKNLFSQTVIISGYDSGSYRIDPFPIYFLNAQKNTDSVLTNEFIVRINTLDVDTSKPIKPIKAPLEVPYQIKEFAWWILAAVLLLTLIIGYILYRRYKKKNAVTEEKFKPKEPAHIWAMNELNKLEAEKLWQSDQHKKYYSRLSDIIRLYMEYQFDIYAMESTTDEIEKLISDIKLNKEHKNRLQETLQLADFVKFAKLTPMPDQNTRSMENAKAFVNYTKPTEQEKLETQQNQDKK
jgi:hypothetical protein